MIMIINSFFYYFKLVRLNYMWKHLNIRDKHKYYETATKARTMYNLPELPCHAGNNFNWLKLRVYLLAITD